MVLIIFSEDCERTTDEVVQWLLLMVFAFCIVNTYSNVWLKAKNMLYSMPENRSGT